MWCTPLVPDLRRQGQADLNSRPAWATESVSLPLKLGQKKKEQSKITTVAWIM